MIRDPNSRMKGSDLALRDVSLQTHSLSDGAVTQTRSGRFHPLACPYGIFATRDGYLFICAAADRHWRDVCAAMDRPDLAAPGHPWALRPSREAARDEVNGFLEAWLCSLPSRDSALALLQRHRVPVGPVLGIDEVARDPALREVGSVLTASDPVLGGVDVPGFPLRFSAAETGPDMEAPFLGEHNRAIVVDLAGRDPGEYDALVSAGVLQSEPVHPRPSRQR